MSSSQKNKRTRKVITLFILVAAVAFIFYTVLFSNVILQSIFYEKIWVHRVNSVEKLAEVEDAFYGVELDIVYHDSLNAFDVTHPPEPSIGLSLSTYLSSCANRDLHFWLDFKNLNDATALSSVERLNHICGKLNIDKKRFIIESQNPQFLKKFHESGFVTSYYLPWPGLYQLKNDTLQGTINTITDRLNTDLDYISSNYHDYPIMKNNFPAKNKLLWLTGLEKEYSFTLRERIFLYQILMDEKVNILLIQYDSKAKTR